MEIVLTLGHRSGFRFVTTSFVQNFSAWATFARRRHPGLQKRVPRQVPALAYTPSKMCAISACTSFQMRFKSGRDGAKVRQMNVIQQFNQFYGSTGRRYWMAKIPTSNGLVCGG